MMRAHRFALAAVALAALGACTSLQPKHERPAAPVPAAFPQLPGSAPANDGRLAADIGWQDFFADARLKRLIEIALANNRDLRLAVLNIEQARAQFDNRSADALPTVNAGVNASRAPTASGSVNTSYSAGVLVTAYELDLFGRVRSLADASLAQFLATEETRKAVQISLVAAVANAYLALQADDELLRVTQQALATREDSLRLTKLRFDNGASSMLDLRLAESLLESARASLALLRRQRLLDLNALVLLLGQSVPDDLPAALPLVAQPGSADLPAGLPSEVLVQRPDVLAAEQQLRAANANIGAARAAFFPRISLTGSVGTVSSELTSLFKAGSFGWSFAPQLLLPIFDAGRNQANLQLSQVARDQAVAQYERAIQQAFREVADALAGRATLAEQLAAQQAQVRAEEDRLRLADLRYRNGIASFLEVLDAQRSLLTAQQAQVQVQAQLVQNRVSVYRVLGGGLK